MNLEQVKEHFKYAKEVRCLANGQIFNITEKGEKGIYKADNCFWVSHKIQCLIFDGLTNQLAEILSYIFDRGEEVEVQNGLGEWIKRYFIGLNKNGNPVTENKNGEVCSWKAIRKLTPESLLEPQLSEFKKFAESKMNCTVTVIFENK